VDAPDSYSRMKSKNSASVEDERTASKLMHVGRLSDAQRRYTEAESFLTRAFGIEKALHCIDHPHTGITRIKLGLHDYLRGRYAQAAGLFRQGLKAVGERPRPRRHRHGRCALQPRGRSGCSGPPCRCPTAAASCLGDCGKSGTASACGSRIRGSLQAIRSVNPRAVTRQPRRSGPAEKGVKEEGGGGRAGRPAGIARPSLRRSGGTGTPTQ